MACQVECVHLQRGGQVKDVAGLIAPSVGSRPGGRAEAAAPEVEGKHLTPGGPELLADEVENPGVAGESRHAEDRLLLRHSEATGPKGACPEAHVEFRHHKPGAGA